MSSVLVQDVDAFLRQWVSHIEPKAFAALFGLGLIGLLYRIRRKRSKLPLPPGPKQLPIIGNLLDLPKNPEWEAYAKMGKELQSEMIHLNILGQPIIYINSLRVAHELLEKRAIIYSGRPTLVMASEIIRCGYFFSTMHYGAEWKRRRILFHQQFHPSQTSRYHPYALRTIRKNLHLFLDDPENFSNHIRLMIASAATSMSYGIDVKDNDNPYIVNAERALKGLTTAQVPGRFLVEMIPMLKYVPAWFPGAEFKRLGAIWAKQCSDMIELPFAHVKRERSEGRNLDPSFASRCLDAIKGVNVEEEEAIIKESVGTFYLGAVDTSSVAVHNFFLAMILHPDVQKKAQEELDRILPRGELPDFIHEVSLPYTSAVVKEVLRWLPVAPIGLPHLLVTDDEFEGYFLPKGSLVVGNSWAMLHDEQVYPNPHQFRPERFLKGGQIDPNVRDPANAGLFGFGRRVCPGAHVAKSLTWLAIATILRTLDISKARDENGVEITPKIEFRSGIVSHPSHFECTLKPRSSATRDMIRSAADFEVEIF